MEFINKNGKGLLLCLAIAIPSWFLGKAFPIIGGAVIAILAGMIVTIFFKKKGSFEAGIKFTSKKILQWAVILLGFGLNLNVIVETGKQSLPIIVCTIATSLIIAFILHKAMHIPSNISTLVGVGSSICGGSAIAATAPVIDADDEEVAQAISIRLPLQHVLLPGIVCSIWVPQRWTRLSPSNLPERWRSFPSLWFWHSGARKSKTV